MFTFDDQLTIVEEETGLSDAASIVKFKRDINRGGNRLIAALGREYNRRSRTSNLVAGRQYYQYPEDALRISLVIAASGGFNIPLDQVADEQAWRYMNSTKQTGQPTHYFVRGFDEIGLFPQPAVTVISGLEIVFEPRSDYFRASDFSTGLVTVTQGTQTVTHSANGFTSAMVGRGFEVTDETDTRWYRVKDFVSTSQITLENYYQGASGSGKPFRIGQVMDFPEEYLEGPAIFAIWRHHKRRGNSNKANEAKQDFGEILDMAKEEYAQQTSSQVILASDTSMNRAFNSFRGDSPATITTTS